HQDGMVLRSLAAGARGYILKDVELGELKRMIRAAYRGESVLDPVVAPHVIAAATGNGDERGHQRVKNTLALSDIDIDIVRQLAPKGFSIFLPTLDVWTRRGGERRMSRVPMFPGYVFLHHALDKWSDVEVRKARGLVAILGESWERRAEVPPAEVDAIRRVTT